MNDEDIVLKLMDSYTEIDKVFLDFKSLLRFVIYCNFGDRISGFYSLIDDNEKFSKIMNFFSGASITFPTAEEFKSSIILAVIYYYKEVLHYSWKQIQNLMPDEKDISLRYGYKLKNVKRSIKNKLNEIKKEDSMFDL